MKISGNVGIAMEGNFGGAEPKKGKCEPPQYHCHWPSACKGEYLRYLPKKEDKKFIIKDAIN